MSGGNQHENLVAGTSKSRKLQSENLDEIKSSLRKEIMSYFTKTLAENQMEMLKLIAPTAKKKLASPPETVDTDSEPANVPPTISSTPVNSKTSTTTKKAPVNSRKRKVNIVIHSSDRVRM